jgi:hypothetical protein
MDDAALNLGLREDGMNRLFEPGQAIDAGNEDVLHAAGL